MEDTKSAFQTIKVLLPHHPRRWNADSDETILFQFSQQKDSCLRFLGKQSISKKRFRSSGEQTTSGLT